MTRVGEAAGTGLELRDVRHSFDLPGGPSTEVFAGLNLKVEPGEFVAIVGPSGCGKTTLLRIMHGLQTPTSGQLLIGGEPIKAAGDGKVAMVFQQDSLLPWRKVWRNVTFGSEMRADARSRSVDRRRAEELLATVGLEGFSDHHPRQLSGGMRQRVNLARALYVEPQVLLMDEPFASLDAQTQDDMQEELLRVWHEFRNTVVFVTHRLEEAVYLADRVVVLTKRPARIKEEIAIDLGRPRSIDIKRSPAFNLLVDRVNDALRGEH